MGASIVSLDVDEAYHAHPAVGSTALRAALRSPRHYQAEYITGEITRAETPAMTTGTAVHCAVLEPAKWARLYVVAPKCDRRTKEGKAAWAAFSADVAARGLRIISEDDHALVESIAGAVRAHPAAAALIAAAEGFEVPLLWRDEASGVQCKGKVDLVARVERAAVLCDIKTTEDASPEGFARSIAKWSLHTQAAHYMAGWQADRGEEALMYVLIVVEKSAPHIVATYALDAYALERGAGLRAQALEIISEGHETGAWPGYSDQIETISLPAWAA